MGIVPRNDAQDSDSRWFLQQSTAEWSVSFVAAFCFLLPLYRYVTYRIAGREFSRDAQVWVSVGESVLKGQVLYAGVVDNKPPLWEGITIFASATPRPYLVLLFVVGVSSASLVILIAQLAKQFVSDQAAVVAAVLFGFGFLQATNGFINNKTLALACLCVGLLSRREVASGFGYASSVLVAQQVLVAAPVVCWWEWQRGSDFRRLSAIVFGVPVAAYVAVGLIWGINALTAGVNQTIFLAGDYAAGASQFDTNGSPLTHPIRYIDLFSSRVGMFTPVLGLASIGVAQLVNRSEGAPRGAWLSLGLLMALALPLGIRLYRHYWLLPLVGAVLLAAYGADWLLSAYE